MRWVPDTTGRLAKRPHYDPAEIDAECEATITKFLTERHTLVRFPIATNDLTILIERDAEDLDLFADFGVDAQDVHGRTDLYRSRRPSVHISRTLSEDPKRANRYRTTLTHEYWHVKFHAPLWLHQASPLSFLGSSSAIMPVPP